MYSSLVRPLSSTEIMEIRRNFTFNTFGEILSNILNPEHSPYISYMYINILNQYLCIQFGIPQYLALYSFSYICTHKDITEYAKCP